MRACPVRLLLPLIDSERERDLRSLRDVILKFMFYRKSSKAPSSLQYKGGREYQYTKVRPRYNVSFRVNLEEKKTYRHIP